MFGILIGMLKDMQVMRRSENFHQDQGIPTRELQNLPEMQCIHPQQR